MWLSLLSANSTYTNDFYALVPTETRVGLYRNCISVFETLRFDRPHQNVGLLYQKSPLFIWNVLKISAVLFRCFTADDGKRRIRQRTRLNLGCLQDIKTPLKTIQLSQKSSQFNIRQGNHFFVVVHILFKSRVTTSTLLTNYLINYRFFLKKQASGKPSLHISTLILTNYS